MSNKYIKELYGPGGTFYSGRHLGTSGADTYYSSYIGNKKSHPPAEDIDEDDDDTENKNDAQWNIFQDDTTKEPKRFQCDFCVPAKCYTRRSNLKAHISAVHENKSEIVYEEPKVRIKLN